MSELDRSAELQALVPIEWWPDAWRLSSIVRRSRVAEVPDAALKLKQGISLYGAWPLNDPKLARKFGDYVYGGATNLEYANETMNFLWNPPLKQPEDGEESDFIEELVDEYPGSMDYSWPNVLIDLRMIVDRSQAGQSGFSLDLNAAVDRGLWRNGVSVECRTRTRVYASTQPPPDAKVECDQPIATEIRGDFYGQPIRLPACLHPLVILESINSDQAEIFDCTPTRDSLRTGNKLTYRPTNHQTWQDHICSNKVTKDNGLWRRVEVTVVPPALPGLSYT